MDRRGLRAFKAALANLTSAAFVQFFLSYSANIRASLEVFGVCVTCCMARLLAKMANQLRITLACDVANLQRAHANQKAINPSKLGG